MLWNYVLAPGWTKPSDDSKKITLPKSTNRTITGYSEEYDFESDRDWEFDGDFNAEQDWGGLCSAWEAHGIKPSTSEDRFDTKKLFENLIV